MGNQDNITLVSGFWDVVGAHTQRTASAWLINTMKINQRMYFFCDEATKPYIEKCREGRETIFVIHNFADFYVKGIYNDAWRKDNMEEIPSYHYGMTLAERMNLIKMAKDADGNNATPYYVWYDPLFEPYRNSVPSNARLNFDDTPAFLCSRIGVSLHYPEEEEKVVDGNAYIVHKEMVDDIFLYYYNLLKRNYRLVDKRELRTDETIMSVIYKDMPTLFYDMSAGPGSNLLMIYTM